MRPIGLNKRSLQPTGVVVVVAALLASGCAAETMKGLRERAPLIEADSGKPTDAIGSCLVAASEPLGQASYVPNPHGAVIAVQVSAGMFGGEAPMLSARINDQGTDRHVTIWMKKSVWAKQNRHQLDALRACL